MAAIAINPKYSPMQGLVPIIFRLKQLTTLDWINLPGARGFVFAAGYSSSTANNTVTGIIAFNHGQALINGVKTATDTTVAIDGAGAGGAGAGRIVPYFARCASGEIIEVISETLPETAASTLTIRRGCLGTTAATLADNDYISILNQFVIVSATVGEITAMAFPMPEDAGSKTFV
jgi:hypothetical protein